METKRDVAIAEATCRRRRFTIVECLRADWAAIAAALITNDDALFEEAVRCAKHDLSRLSRSGGDQSHWLLSMQCIPLEDYLE